MKNIKLFSFVFVLSLILIGFNSVKLAHAQATLLPGCTATSNYSTTTGQACGNTVTTQTDCAPGDNFSFVTGQPCTTTTTPPTSSSSLVDQFNSLDKSTFVIGYYGSDVKPLQQFLKVQGYYFGKVDGHYGRITARAVSDFKSDYGIATTTITTTTPTITGTYYWYFDSTSTACAYKEFFGSYMYQGLQTFTTQADCQAHLSSNTTSSPTISGVSGPQTLNVNQSGTWSVNASDSSNSNLSYSVQWGDEKYVAYSTANSASGIAQQSATFTHTYTVAGTYNPTFTVTNASGKTAQTSLSVVVGNGVVSGCPSSTGFSSTTGLACNTSLSVAKNFAYGDQTVSPGTTNVKVASFVFSAGNTEGVNVKNIDLGLNNNNLIQNLHLVVEATGQIFGSTEATPITGDNDFSGSFNVPAGGSVIVDAYADILSSATNGYVPGPAVGIIDCNGSGAISNVFDTCSGIPLLGQNISVSGTTTSTTPIISSLSPATVSTGGTFVIYGTGFLTSSQVEIGTSFISGVNNTNNGTALVVTVPSNFTPGNYAVSVINGSITSNSLTLNVFSSSSVNNTITVTSPSNGTQWTYGTPQTITWVDNSISPVTPCPVQPPCTTRICPAHVIACPVTINTNTYTISATTYSDPYSPQTTPNMTYVLAYNVPGNSYSWTVGNNLTSAVMASGKYIIQVLQTSSTVHGLSDPFSITK